MALPDITTMDLSEEAILRRISTFRQEFKKVHHDYLLCKSSQFMGTDPHFKPKFEKHTQRPLNGDPLDAFAAKERELYIRLLCVLDAIWYDARKLNLDVFDLITIRGDYDFDTEIGPLSLYERSKYCPKSGSED